MRKVFVNGTFDILHRGHLELLLFAKEQGDFLTVAIDVDDRVKQLKGHTRPINNCLDRMYMLQNLRMVDNVVCFGTDDELISLIKQHDVMIKGADYKDKSIVGEEFIDIIFYDIVNGYSTTKTIQRITDR
jgi:D-beta-D-heptose 7-phosphate kinase/D-beta-D-heptose 1-phosphate adenosyltransferase